MRCFQHPTRDAVGVCSNCGRGLCADCATVVLGKLSCHGACQGEITRQEQLVQNSERATNQRSVVYETSGTMYHQSFAIIGFFGLAFAVLGTVLLLKDQSIVGATFLGIGAIFMIRGIGLARAGKKFRALAAEERSETTET
jgi:hypothetical protein